MIKRPEPRLRLIYLTANKLILYMVNNLSVTARSHRWVSTIRDERSASGSVKHSFSAIVHMYSFYV